MTLMITSTPHDLIQHDLNIFLFQDESPSGFASLWSHCIAEAEETFSIAQSTAEFWTDLPEVIQKS